MDQARTGTGRSAGQPAHNGLALVTIEPKSEKKKSKNEKRAQEASINILQLKIKCVESRLPLKDDI